MSLGYNVATVEIPTIYFDQNRRTHFDPLWDSMRVVAVLSRYALSSLAVTAVDFSAFVLLLPHVSGNVVAANVLARVFAVVAHFVLSREYVFRARGQFKASEVVRYGAIVVANLVLTTWLLLIFQGWGASPVAAKILAQLAGFLVHFRGTRSIRVPWPRRGAYQLGGVLPAPVSGLALVARHHERDAAGSHHRPCPRAVNPSV